MRAVRSAIHASTKSCPMSPVLGQIVPHAPETNVKISWQTCRAAVLRTPASFPQVAIVNLWGHHEMAYIPLPLLATCSSDHMCH